MAGRRKHRQFMESFPSQPDTMRSPPDPNAGRYSTTPPRLGQQLLDTTAFTEDQSWGRVAIFRDPDESAPKNHLLLLTMTLFRDWLVWFRLLSPTRL